MAALRFGPLVGASLGSGPGRWRLFQVPLILLILHSHVLNNTLYLGMYLLVSLCITYVLCSIVRFDMENNEILAIKILITYKEVPYRLLQFSTDNLTRFDSLSLEEIASGMFELLE